MKRFPFKKLDAFSDGRSDGNPAGCIYLGRGRVSPREMQAIAKQLKGFVSEVVFIRPAGSRQGYSCALRYFSSECEVDFCGHGTIAAMYDLIKNNEAFSTQKTVTIKTPKGLLRVWNKIRGENAVYVSAPAPGFIEQEIPSRKLAESLRTDSCNIRADLPLSVINAGLNTLIVPINSPDACLKMSPEIDRLGRFCLDHHLDIITIFSGRAADKKNPVRSRVFAPKYGYLEDPATGSGNSALGYYLLRNRLWRGNPLRIEQGPSRANPNIVRLMLDEAGGRVIFGGSAVARIEGEYLLS